MVKVRVWGVDKNLSQEFEAMIDTGFTGFFKLPIMAALPLALTLRATTNYSLANNTSVSMLLASGTVEMDGMETEGLIVLDSGGGPLIGIEFLKRCEHFIVVSSKLGVVLMEEDFLIKAAEEYAKSQAQKPTAPTEAQAQAQARPILPRPSAKTPK